MLWFKCSTATTKTKTDAVGTDCPAAATAKTILAKVINYTNFLLNDWKKTNTILRSLSLSLQRSINCKGVRLRPKKPTLSQIFTTRLLEFNKDVQQLFINFHHAYDIIISDTVWIAMERIGERTHHRNVLTKEMFIKIKKETKIVCLNINRDRIGQNITIDTYNFEHKITIWAMQYVHNYNKATGASTHYKIY